jgi:hypothetical protein
MDGERALGDLPVCRAGREAERPGRFGDRQQASPIDLGIVAALEDRRRLMDTNKDSITIRANVVITGSLGLDPSSQSVMTGDGW